MSKFYKLPAELFSFELTPKAMIMYAVLADRAELSKKNSSFKDKDGTYIIYPVSDLCTLTGAGERTVRYILAELEDKELITTRKQGKGLPQKIYIHSISDRQKSAGQERQKPAGQDRQKPAGQERQESAGLTSKTESIYTDISKLPELMQMITEVADEIQKPISPKQALKVAKKVIAAKPRSPRAWIKTVIPSAAKEVEGYQATYDIAEYESTSVLDEEWDD